MFSGCELLKDIKPLENWKLSENNYKGMFNQYIIKLIIYLKNLKKTKNQFINSLYSLSKILL